LRAADLATGELPAAKVRDPRLPGYLDVPVVPPMAFCGASPEEEFVVELATQPVSLSCVVCAEAAERNAGDPAIIGLLKLI
jgi:hypothetical protein